MQQTSFFGSAELSKNNSQTLETLRKRAMECVACKLHSTRKNVVWGEGNQNEPLVAFAGEGPGETEDETGRPFVGRAGNLLDRMIQRMGFDRKDLFICNVLCCRPPNNRLPDASEVAACHPFFFGQLRLVRPKVIISLGSTATRTLLRKNKPMGDLRGKWYSWEGIPVRPTYHPAYLLRNPKDRATSLVDLEAVVAFLRNPPKS